jgi:hypothetical protein
MQSLTAGYPHPVTKTSVPTATSLPSKEMGCLTLMKEVKAQQKYEIRFR